MTDELEYTLKVCESLDLDMPYKGWSIKPVKVKNYFDFEQCCDILDIDKNSTGIPEIISMPYLKFLLVIISEMDSKISYKIGVLFNMCLGIESEITIGIDENERCSLVIGDKTMTAKQFDDIRHIILRQNLYSYTDMSKVDPILKKNIQEYYRIKNAGIQEPTLEKKIAVVQSETGLSKKEITDMTIRSFDILFSTIVEKVDYTINRTAELGGMVKFETPIEHWVWKNDKKAFSDAFVSYNQLEKKVKSAN